MFASTRYIVAVLATSYICDASQVAFESKLWPSVANAPHDAWQALNRSVGGRLSNGLPVGLPCHDNFNGISRHPDPAQCKVVEANKKNMTFLTTQMGGYAQGNWGVCQSTGNGCATPLVLPINQSTACGSGNIPTYFLNVSSVMDVQLALEFANEHTVPIVVKNSGHDYKGRSAGSDSLALWVHNFAPEPTLDRDFVPEGCSESVGDVVTFGAGQGFDGLYVFAEANNITIVGGSSPTVAPGGGWITGGGHSGLSPVYGLGVDNVQQVRVVLPNGTYVTANHCQNKDIFFAVRGGGGGTFGVNMEISFLAHPKTHMQWGQFRFGLLNESMQLQLTKILVQNANEWFDDGWGGYAYAAGNRNSTVQMMNPRLSKSEAKQALAPLINLAESLGMLLGKDYNVTDYPSYYQMYRENIQDGLLLTGNAGAAQSSRLIPRSNFEGAENQTTLLNTLVDAVVKKNLLLMLLFVTPAKAIQDSDSSITPAWRRSTWHVINLAAWDPSQITPAQIEDKFSAVTQSMNQLRSITPDGGAYLNEGDTFEPDPVDAFWGAQNYERLLRIKNELDPKKIMQVFGGIGSDWRAPVFNCYPGFRSEDQAPTHGWEL